MAYYAVKIEYTPFSAAIPTRRPLLHARRIPFIACLLLRLVQAGQ